MTEDVCKVAFIGAGYMSAEHIKVFADIPDVKLCGVFSRTKSNAQRIATSHDISTVAESVSDLYEKTHAQLVVICVPELSIREVCLEAFKYPWVCLIEKPAGYDVNDAEDILSAAKKNKTRAFVALNRRHYRSTIQVLEGIASASGSLLIHICDQQDQSVARVLGHPELVIQNWMYANSIHLIDLLTIFGRGEIVSVQPIIFWNPNDPKFVMSKVTFSSGDIGVYEAVWGCPGPWSVTVTGQEKRWEMRPLEKAFCQISGSRMLESLPAHRWDTEFKAGLRMQADEAVKASLGRSHTLPTLGDAFNSMQLVKKIYQEKAEDEPS